MPGMGGAPQNGNSVIVSAFHTELFHQLLVVLLVGAVCAIAFNVIRTVQYRQLRAQGGPTPVVAADATPERADLVSRWVMAEATPLALPDPRWDTLVYGVRDCEEYLRAVC